MLKNVEHVNKNVSLQDAVQLTVQLLDLPDQVNTDLVKEGDTLDLQVKKTRGQSNSREMR